MNCFKLLASIIIFFLISIKLSHSADKVVVMDLDSLLEKTNYGKKIINDLNLIDENNLKSLKKIEKKIKLKISQKQNFIEYSELGLKYIKDISRIIKKNTGGILLIDYGYTQKKMKNTLQAVSNHKFANILDNIGSADITHNINFDLFEKFIKQLKGLETNLTTQKKFLLSMGIKHRAEIISKNQSFLKKADIYYRLNRLIDQKQMGNLFKVMLIKNKKNKFKLGFKD